MFLEDFPQSELVQDAEQSITKLRIKLAEKDFEVGRLYLKLEEYESALIYFRSVLNNYYDTDFSDDARIGIIFTHILNENRQGAKSYFTAEKNRFVKPDKYREAESLLVDTETGLKLAHYYKLYR
jgi:outer membrane protein assembly factor BamD